MKQLLWKVPNLKPAEEEYVRALLMRYIHLGKNGVTPEEVEKMIKDMEANHRDSLEAGKVEAVAEVLRGYFTH